MCASIERPVDNELVSLYSTFFLETRLPRHIRIFPHTTAWSVEEWLLDLLRLGVAQAVDPPSASG